MTKGYAYKNNKRLDVYKRIRQQRNGCTKKSIKNKDEIKNGSRIDANNKALYSARKRNLNHLPNTTLNQMIEQWMKINHVKRKETTEYKYQYLIDNHIAPSIGQKTLQQINQGVLNDFLLNKLENGRLDSSGRGLSSTYVKTIMMIINSSLKLASENGYCAPVKANIVFPCHSANIEDVLNLYEQITLEKYIISNPDTTGAGIILALRAGLRIGEICALKWDDIDLTEKVINIRSATIRNVSADHNYPAYIIGTPKTKNAVRIIPIPDTIMDFLLLIKQMYQNMYVVSETNTYINPGTFEYRFHKLTDKSGIRRMRFHALRHTFATRCIEAGMDEKTLSELLGHANVNITLNTYVHSSIDLKRKQMIVMNELVGNDIFS